MIRTHLCLIHFLFPCCFQHSSWEFGCEESEMILLLALHIPSDVKGLGWVTDVSSGATPGSVLRAASKVLPIVLLLVLPMAVSEILVGIQFRAYPMHSLCSGN